jgi:transposase-like protein
MRGAAGFGIVPRMETENELTRRARRRFSAEEKAGIVGLYGEREIPGG